MPRANNPDLHRQITINFKRKLITPSLGALVGGALTGVLVVPNTPVASVGLALVVSGAFMGALIGNCIVSCVECYEGAQQIRQQAPQDSDHHPDTHPQIHQQAPQGSDHHSDTQPEVGLLDQSLPFSKRRYFTANGGRSQQPLPGRQTANLSPLSEFRFNTHKNPMQQQADHSRLLFLHDTQKNLMEQQARVIASGKVSDPYLESQIQLNGIMLAKTNRLKVNPHYEGPAE